MEPIHILIVDDEALLIESMEIILTRKGKMQVTGKAFDGREALKLLEQRNVDIVLLDLNMKGMGGIELIPILKQKYPALKIMVLTTFYDDHYITDAISNGADGYLLKDSKGEAIIQAIHQILNGQSILDQKVMMRLSKIMTQQTEEVAFPKDLTARELELCALIAEGYTNIEIGKKLYISEGTVKNYVSSIYDKFGLHDRTQLALKLKTSDRKI